MLFYFHGGDLGPLFIRFLFLMVIFITLALIGTFIWALLYVALHKPKDNSLELTILNNKKDENSSTPKN